MTQEGTNIYALNSNGTGTINYDIANDLNILASKDTYSYTSEENTRSAGGSVGTNGVQFNYDQSDASSKVRSTTYNNVDIIGNNINIKTGNNTDIKGANVLAQAITDNSNNTIGGNIDLNIGNNLNIESLQDSYYAKSKSSSFGISAGGGKNKDGGTNGNAGFNFGKTDSTTDSQWVSQQTSIIGDNNVNIKTNNNTNLIGSVVASNSDNLSLTTNSLTYQDLNDYYTSTTKGNGLTTNVGTSSESFFKGIAPNGTTTITLVNSGEDKKQNTRATIGNGSIVIADNKDISDLNRDMTKSQETTQDQITGALNGEMKIDNRIFTPDGLVSIYSDAKNLAGNTFVAVGGALSDAKLILDTSADILGAIPGSPIWMSRYINKNNGENIPAPNLFPGMFMTKSETGQTPDPNDPKFSDYIVGNKNPLFKLSWHVIPGVKSATETHDFGMDKDEKTRGNANLITTIVPYFILNYYSSVGTMIDSPNYNKNYTEIKKSIQNNVNLKYYNTIYNMNGVKSYDYKK